MPAQDELPKLYDPKVVESETYKRWLDAGRFDAVPDDRPPDQRYVIMIPLPNVTGALHLGHALNHTCQDVMIRWQRMQGKNTLWMPGTDHAGIATQSVVERRIFEEEGKTRHDIGREELVRRIWEWKDEYEVRITAQMKMLGNSCDWKRQRFTLDEMCTRAVRHTFFHMFRDGLIYRGKRLVNWDTHLQTAVADDEVYHQTVQSHFWHMRYPLKDPGPNDPRHLVVATTRPETMLGDTAVAVNPNDQRFKHLVDKTVILPLLHREIPIIADDWADPEKGSGCVKITPAHDPNDYQVGLRHHLPMINVLNPDGSINADGGPYQGLDRFEARKRIVADLDAAGLLDRVEDHEVEVGHSDRSKTIVEPYLSDQWFVRMSDVAGGVKLADGSTVPGLAQAAMDAVTSGRVQVFPPRYAKSYLDWLGEKRDWCISRQLWWGHRIPAWSFTETMHQEDVKNVQNRIQEQVNAGLLAYARPELPSDEPFKGYYCPSPEINPEFMAFLASHGFSQEEDVLDTWFSSQLWPHSTLGWPDKTESLAYYYPGSVLITSRDIITLWVARMVIAGLYNVGDVPFRHVYIHPKIVDGRGETMSKSKGNGVDPLDIITVYGADALRYGMAAMTTETQDIRLPVEYRCTHCQHLIPQTRQNMKAKVIKCPDCKQDFATQWADAATAEKLGRAYCVSEKFEVGRNFCNKLWNAARFAFMNLENTPCDPIDVKTLPIEDRWILAQISKTAATVNEALTGYQYSRAINTARDFFWDSLCDWYLELIKSRIRDKNRDAEAKQVLAFVLDQSLRLMHPVIPFITERIWRQLNDLAPTRGLPGAAELTVTDEIIVAPFPPPGGYPTLTDEAVLATFTDLQDATRGVRDARSRHNVPPKDRVAVTIKAPADHIDAIKNASHVIERLAGVNSLTIDPNALRQKNAAAIVSGGLEIFVADIADDEAELKKTRQELANVDQQISGKSSKLANESFVSRAPADVVDRERAQLEELKRKRRQLFDHVAALES
jgi:valyl-tRNA synthetase